MAKKTGNTKTYKKDVKPWILKHKLAVGLTGAAIVALIAAGGVFGGVGTYKASKANSKVKEQQGLITKQGQTIDEQGKTINEKDKTINEKDQTIKGQESDISGLESKVKELEEKLKQNPGDEELRAQLEQAKADKAAAEEERDKAKEEAASKDETIKEKDNIISGKDEELGKKDETIKDKNKELGEKDKTIEDLQNQLNEKPAERSIEFTEDQMAKLQDKFFVMTGDTIETYESFNYEGGRLSMYFKGYDMFGNDTVFSIGVDAKSASFKQEDVMVWLDNASKSSKISERPDITAYKDIEAYQFDKSVVANVKAMKDGLNQKELSKAAAEVYDAQNYTIDASATDMLYAIEVSSADKRGNKTATISTLYIDENGNYVENKNAVASKTLIGNPSQESANYTMFKAYAESKGVKEPAKSEEEQIEG